MPPRPPPIRHTASTTAAAATKATTPRAAHTHAAAPSAPPAAHAIGSGIGSVRRRGADEAERAAHSKIEITPDPRLSDSPAEQGVEPSSPETDWC